MANKRTIVGLGEVLWDVLAQERHLGGAPTNFAYVANLLGDEGVIASRVGKDELGSDTKSQIRRLGLATDWLQIDDDHATGTAKVELDGTGQASYRIAEPVAWDFLEWTVEWNELAAKADAVCFGSLAQRSSVSRITIRNQGHGSEHLSTVFISYNLPP